MGELGVQRGAYDICCVNVLPCTHALVGQQRTSWPMNDVETTEGALNFKGPLGRLWRQLRRSEISPPLRKINTQTPGLVATGGTFIQRKTRHFRF